MVKIKTPLHILKKKKLHLIRLKLWKGLISWMWIFWQGNALVFLNNNNMFVKGSFLPKKNDPNKSFLVYCSLLFLILPVLLFEIKLKTWINLIIFNINTGFTITFLKCSVMCGEIPLFLKSSATHLSIGKATHLSIGRAT